jgi:hypothetical protein
MTAEGERVSLGSLLTWDGVVPAVVAAFPGAIEQLFPGNNVAEVAAAVVAPIIAALVRSSLGMRQLERILDGVPSVARQITFAAAIALLMLFEGYVAMLTFADDEPWWAWLTPAGLYACYLAAIILALRPRGQLPLG